MINKPSGPFFQAIWLVGFRPFFALTFLLGFALPLVWASLYSGYFNWDPSPLSPSQWHGHEMFFGFGWALLAGFLLTASKNWVSIRGLHGAGLALAAALWFVDRLVVSFYPTQDIFSLVLGNLFITYVVAYLLFTLIKYRANDSFGDNYLFYIALPLFIPAKNLILDIDTFSQGIAMTTGLFRVTFVIMFERTMAQFMKNAMNTPLPRLLWLDYSIKILMLFSVVAVFLPDLYGAGLLIATASLLAFRFLIWKPHVGMKNFGIAVMYLGYLGLTIHLYLEGFRQLQGSLGVGALSLHVFTFFSMGMIIPSMMIRISQGHTGRKPIFLGRDRVALAFMALGGLSRVVFTQIWPDYYVIWVALSGLGWSVCFAILGLRLMPFLFQPRIDGKEH
ncbi:MAG: NnrS family protein [SAR324 cluster bacterium]|nr:NnrS family protein [SAR324 cluster bacterium]